MIDRYCTREMGGIWSESYKLSRWLSVEIAIIKAKVQLGIYPEEALEIEKIATFCPEKFVMLDISLRRALDKTIFPKEYRDFLMDKLADSIFTGRVEEIEHGPNGTHHDLLAFIQAVQESLPENLKKYFHGDETSYDIEEPAFNLRIIEALDLITNALKDLMKVVGQKAIQYKKLVRIERSHGKHAEPDTLGLMFLGWYDSLERQIAPLATVWNEIHRSKISGAVGTYTGDLSPELETCALSFLGLIPARFSTQIIMRDRHANVLNALAVLAAVVENMALNIRLLSQTEISEIQEPFGKGQKGSSRMPHKKNPILSENLCGLARLVRHYHGVALENIPTWGGRDISHSSPERIIFPDAFQIVHFMLKRIKKVMRGLVINEENIKRNLEMTNGIIFSPEVKKLLMNEGVEPEEAYRITQQAAFEAVKTQLGVGTHIFEICLRHRVPERVKEKLNNAFSMEKKLENIDKIFARFDLKEK